MLDGEKLKIRNRDLKFDSRSLRVKCWIQVTVSGMVYLFTVKSANLAGLFSLFSLSTEKFNVDYIFFCLDNIIFRKLLNQENLIKLSNILKLEIIFVQVKFVGFTVSQYN